MHYSLAHAEHAVNLLDTKPMENVGHQGLETHILDSSHVLGPLEVVRSFVFTSLPCVIDNWSHWLDTVQDGRE